MTRSVRLPLALLALAGGTVIAGLIAWGNTRHLACDDTEDPVMSFVYFARWGGLGTAVASLLAAWIASRRALGHGPSRLFTSLCLVAAIAGLVACAAPHSESLLVAPAVAVLVVATLAVIVYFLPALVILTLAVGATRWWARNLDEPRRRLRTTQAVAMWSAFVLAPGCAGAGLITQYPICLG
jgi:hypothetical protein